MILDKITLIWTINVSDFSADLKGLFQCFTG